MRSIWSAWISQLKARTTRTSSRRLSTHQNRRSIVACEALEIRTLLSVNPVFNEGDTATFSGSFEDPYTGPIDPDSVTASLGDVTWNATDNIWSWSFDTGDGPYSKTVIISATDAIGNTVQSAFNLTVNNVAPVINTATTAVNMYRGQTSIVTGIWFDPGDDASLYADIGDFEYLADGTWQWSTCGCGIPDGETTVTIYAYDWDGDENQISFTLHIDPNPVQIDPSEIQLDTFEGASATFSGTWSDSSTTDLLSLSADYGSIVANSDGTWTWSYNAPGVPFVDWVTITGENSLGVKQSTQFVLNVQDVPPVVTSDADSVATDVGQLVTMTGTWGDSFGDDVTLSASFGDITKNDDGTWEWSYLVPNYASYDEFDETVYITANDSDYGQSDTSFNLHYNDYTPLIDSSTDSITFAPGALAQLTGTWTSYSGSLTPTDLDAANAGVQLYASTGDVTKNDDGTWNWTLDTTGLPPQTIGVSLLAIDGDGDQFYFNFDLHLADAPPVVAADTSSTNLGSNLVAGMTGTWSDPAGDYVDLSADFGWVTKYSDGTWDWSYDAHHGPVPSNTVTITAQNSAGLISTTTFDVIVDNYSPMDLHVQGGTVAENAPFSLNGTFVDYDSLDEHTVFVDWGDGYSEAFTLPVGSRAFSFVHVYTESSAGLPTGAFSPIVSVSDDGGLTKTATSQISLISRDPSGGSADNDSFGTSISADGRFVAFASYASNLVADDTNDSADIFVYDRQTGTITRVSVKTDGTEANSDSYYPKISADGRFVTYESDADNLVDDDNNFSTDIFIFDRQTGTTSRVSVRSDGGESDDDSSNASISADGRFIAYESWADNLVDDDTNDSMDVFVFDRLLGITTRVSVNSNGEEGDDFSYHAAISADGKFVAFTSYALNLDVNVIDCGCYADLFLRDLELGTTTRIGEEGDNASLSSDGRYIAYDTTLDHTELGDNNYTLDVYVYDRVLGTTVLVSTNLAGESGDAPSGVPVISGNGRFVAFESFATNLDPIDPDAPSGAISDDIFVHDLFTGTTSLVTVNPERTRDFWSATLGGISADGKAIVFDSYLDIYTSADNNDCSDIFIATNPVYPDPQVIVTNVNDAPIFSSLGNRTLTSIASNISNAANVGTYVTQLIANLTSTGGSITDDDADALQGIAVTRVDSTNGTWQYTTDNGAHWSDFGAPTAATARLLASDADTRIRFIPNTGYTGSATFIFVAWDQTTGTNGDTAIATNRGGTKAFSLGYDTASIKVLPAVNTAPVFDSNGSPTLTSIARNVSSEANSGTLISQLIANLTGTGGSISDPDYGALQGIAVTRVDNTHGTWQYITPGLTDWVAFGTPTASAARLLASDAGTRIRFVPNTGFSGSSTFVFVAWDQTSGTNGGTAIATNRGGSKAFSLGYDTATIAVTVSNTAPTLDPHGRLTLSPVPGGITDPVNAGTSIAQLLANLVSVGGGITDPEANSESIFGIAVTGADQSNGTWQFTTDNGAHWIDFGTPGVGDARLLAGTSNTKVRFRPNTGFAGTATLTFVAWDLSAGTNGGTAVATKRGGSSPFSLGYDVANLDVFPVDI